MFLTWPAPKFCCCYAARSDLPTKSRKGIIFSIPTNLSFAMQHSMLLSKLRSITRFSLQPFTSHWCTIKRSHSFSLDLGLDSTFTTIMTNFRTSPQIHWLGGIHDTNQYTYQSNFIKALWYKGHTTLNFTKSTSWYTGMATFHISAKSYSWTLFKHQTGASPLPFSCGTNASRFTSRYFRIPSVYSADYRAKYIIEQNRERSLSSQFAPAQVLDVHIFIVNYPTYWK